MKKIDHNDGKMIKYCKVCKKETKHYEYAPWFLSDVIVCSECRTLKDEDK